MVRNGTDDIQLWYKVKDFEFNLALITVPKRKWKIQDKNMGGNLFWGDCAPLSKRVKWKVLIIQETTVDISYWGHDPLF